MKKIFTLISVALVAMNADAQNTFKWCVPEDFNMTEYHKFIEAKDADGNLMGTIEMLSSPNKNDLFEELKDENGDKKLGDDEVWNRNPINIDDIRFFNIKFTFNIS